jgi:hypothetical protein
VALVIGVLGMLGAFVDGASRRQVTPSAARQPSREKKHLNEAWSVRRYLRNWRSARAERKLNPRWCPGAEWDQRLESL